MLAAEAMTAAEETMLAWDASRIDIDITHVITMVYPT